MADDLRERMAWTHKPRHDFADYDTMLADPALEAVIIATSDAFHVPAAIRALEAGKRRLPTCCCRWRRRLRHWSRSCRMSIS